jgi:hypothetical protein
MRVVDHHNRNLEAKRYDLHHSLENCMRRLLIASLLLSVAACGRQDRGRREAVAKAQAEMEGTSTGTAAPPASFVPSPGSTFPDGIPSSAVTITYLRTERGPAGMLKMILSVRNDSGVPIREVDGRVVITTSQPQQQLLYEIRTNVAAHETRQYAMDVEPRWSESDAVTDARFTVDRIMMGAK